MSVKMSLGELKKMLFPKIHIQVSLNTFRDFFRMGTFIDCTLMKL